MNISVSDQINERIRRKVDSGQYPSTDEALARALTLLEEHDANWNANLPTCMKKCESALHKLMLANS